MLRGNPAGQVSSFSYVFMFRVRDMHELGKIRPYWCPGQFNVLQASTKELIVGSHTDHIDKSVLPAYQTVEVPINNGNVELTTFSDDWLHKDSRSDWLLFNNTCGMSFMCDGA
jgi:hypothetical protein